MRGPLVILMLSTLTGVFALAACANETVPDDLVQDDEPAATAARDAGKGATPTKRPKDAGPGEAAPLPPGTGGPATPDASTTDAGAGTPPKDAGPGPGKGTDAGKTVPPGTPFKRMDIRYPVEAGDYVLQCTLDAKTQLVWKTSASGTDENARFADPAYGQQPNVYGGCGAKVNGEYPLVFSSLADGALPAGTYVVKCSSATRGDVYRVSGALEGHPSATFMYDEAVTPGGACAGQ